MANPTTADSCMYSKSEDHNSTNSAKSMQKGLQLDYVNEDTSTYNTRGKHNGTSTPCFWSLVSSRKSALVKAPFCVAASDDEVAKSNKLLQNVKYDSSTGKMYEELGASATNNATNALAPSGHPAEIVTSVNSASAAAAAAAATAAALAGNDYYQSYQTYPYGSSNYMSGFSYGNTATGATATYDRSVAAVPTSMYNPYNSPATAFVPHSAINLSVKPGTETSAGPQSSLDLSETTAAGSASITAPYLVSQQDFSGQPTDNSTVEVSRSAVSTGHSIQTNSSPQILDLTRPGSLVPGTNPGSFNVPTIPTVPASIGQSLTKSTTSEGSSNSKREQTEPMDFSSGQAMTFANRSFDTSSFNRGTSPGDLSRFRSSASNDIAYLHTFYS